MTAERDKFVSAAVRALIEGISVFRFTTGKNTSYFMNSNGTGFIRRIEFRPVVCKEPYALVAHVRFDRGRMKFNSFAYLISRQNHIKIMYETAVCIYCSESIKACGYKYSR